MGVEEAWANIFLNIYGTVNQFYISGTSDQNKFILISLT